MNEWISVKDRLPEEYGQYLVFVGFNKQIRTTWFAPSIQLWHGESMVTHWQPLPQPPEQESDDDDR